MERRGLIDMIAYIPFLDPLDVFHEWWFALLIPLSFGISVIYRALKLPSLEHYWRRVMTMTAQIVLIMMALGIAVVIVVVQVIPRLS